MATLYSHHSAIAGAPIPVTMDTVIHLVVDCAMFIVPLENVYCPLDDSKMPQHATTTLQDLLRQRREAHCQALWQEVERLTKDARALGVQRVILFGSLVWGNPGLTSDVDLLLIWDTPLGFLERTAEVYRRLQPQVAADLFVYTPDELTRMAHTPFVRRALAEGRVLYAA